MAGNRLVLPGFQGEVIEKDGVCYQFAGFSSDEPYTDEGPDAVFDTCLDCQIELCGCKAAGANDDPKVRVTLTFSTDDVPEAFVDWLGCTWFSGTPKDVCPTNYGCSPGLFGNEYWDVSQGANARLYLRNDQGTYYGPYVNHKWRVALGGGHKFYQRGYKGYYGTNWLAYGATAVGITVPADLGINLNNLVIDHSINEGSFGFADFNNGITVTWDRGPDGDVDGWGCS